jgi:hypothetical protein
MTKSPQQWQHQHDSVATSRHSQVTSAATSHLDQCPLDNAITSRTQQHRCQQNLAAPSSVWLGNTVTSMTQYLHRTVAKSPQQYRRQHHSVAPLPAWLNIYIASQPSWPDSTVTSMNRHLHWRYATAWSPTSTIYDFSGKQTHCQLILVLFTIMFGSRANTSVLMHCLAPSWSIYISKTYVWRP